MTDPKKDPTRRCMPVEEWPETDRAAWERALRDGHMFDESGLGAHWRPMTRKKVASSYGRFLTFLATKRLLDPSVGPNERMDVEVLQAFVAELDKQVAPVTVGQRLTDLYEAFRVMAPDIPLPALRRAARRRSAVARPSRNKCAKVVHPAQLLRCGLRLMDEVIGSGEHITTKHAAAKYRNGLMIAILACRAIRRSNFCSLEIGRHILKDEDGYVLALNDSETKNHSAFEPRLPEILTPYIERYISYYRPILLAGRENERLWISDLGRAMAHGSIYDVIRETTQKEFGVPINLHLFRDCQATFMAVDDPGHVRATPRILGHNDFGTAERFYNQAGSVEAARCYQAGMLAIRRKLVSQPKPRRKRAGGK